MRARAMALTFAHKKKVNCRTDGRNSNFSFESKSARGTTGNAFHPAPMYLFDITAEVKNKKKKEKGLAGIGPEAFNLEGLRLFSFPPPEIKDGNGHFFFSRVRF